MLTAEDLDRMSHWSEDGQMSAEDQRALVGEVRRLHEERDALLMNLRARDLRAHREAIERS